MSMQRKIAGVMESGADKFSGNCLALCSDVDQTIARLGSDLLNGGGCGFMEEVAKSFTAVNERLGISIGILRPKKRWMRPNRYIANAQNHYLELVIRTHPPKSDKFDLSRNHMNVLTPKAVVFFHTKKAPYWS